MPVDPWHLAGSVLDGGLAVLGIALLLRWAALAVLSAWDWVLRQRRPLPETLPEGFDGGVAVVIPAYDEEAVLEGAVASALASDLPDLRVVVVDDGSTDGTWKVARRLARDPRVTALPQRPNQGKPAALDAGIAATEAELVVTVDADTVLSRDAVRLLVAPLAHDPGLGAVAGNIKVGNRTGVLTLFQSLEYITGLNLGRRAQHVLGCITTVPGAAAAWRRAAVAEVGGVPGDTRIEDTDLTLTLQRAGWRVVYQPAAVAYTEAPDTWRGLVAQRTRWIGGYLQVLAKHRGGFLAPNPLGLLGLPDLLYRNALAFLLLPLVIPGIWRVLQAFSLQALLEFLVGLVAFDLLATTLAYAEDRERPMELLWAPVRRLIWPWFLAGVLLRVVVLAARHGEVPWAPIARRGVLARASRSGPGPRIVRQRR
jgi:peptidoglycan-N-acetylglucosamine deacetylase